MCRDYILVEREMLYDADLYIYKFIQIQFLFNQLAYL